MIFVFDTSKFDKTQFRIFKGDDEIEDPTISQIMTFLDSNEAGRQLAVNLADSDSIIETQGINNLDVEDDGFNGISSVPTDDISDDDTIVIDRYFADDKSSLGTMKIPGISTPIYTLELPWINNSRSISCIPKGIYPIRRIEASPRFSYPHIHILNVPGRDYIKIHIANKPEDIRGCVGVGLNTTDDWVGQSRIALTSIMDTVDFSKVKRIKIT